jgi:hypothetical protein
MRFVLAVIFPCSRWEYLHGVLRRVEKFARHLARYRF